MVEAVFNRRERERRKELPEGVDFWDFDCKFGHTADESKAIHVSEIPQCINDAEAQQLESPAETQEASNKGIPRLYFFFQVFLIVTIIDSIIQFGQLRELLIMS